MSPALLAVALVAAGALLLSAGVAVVVAAVWGAAVGIGAGAALLGVQLVAGGLFVVPTGSDGGGGLR